MIQIEMGKDIWAPWMRRAIQLASLAEGTTSPNPLVGAIILDSVEVSAR